MSEMTVKRGHPVLGIVLGILGILISFLALLSGVIGGGVAAILGLAALLIGIAARKRGIAAMILGGIAISLAIILTLTTIAMYSTFQEKAAATDRYPLISKSLESPALGMVGMILNLSKLSEADQQNFTEELNRELDLIKQDTDVIVTTEAPSGT